MSKSLILLTGGSGFIGSHTVATFLSSGYRVRVAGRNQKTLDSILAVHRAHRESLETVEVADITKPGAFDKAVNGVDGVIHMASPFTFDIKDAETDLILPAINGTLRVLEAVVKFAPQVKRVVLTSSFAAIADFSKQFWPDHVYNESQWNPMTYEEAKNCGIPGLSYAGGKKLAEEAAWKFVRETPNVKFELATINPVMVYGPPVAGSVNSNHLSLSMSEIYELMNGSLDAAPFTVMPVFVDVRDVAVAQRLAYETEKPGRFAMCSGHFTKAGVCQLFRDELPQIKDKVPAPTQEEIEGPPHYSVDTTRAETILGVKFLPFKETFLDMAEAFLEMEKNK